jgi:hypothetical protein
MRTAAINRVLSVLNVNRGRVWPLFAHSTAPLHARLQGVQCTKLSNIKNLDLK